MRHDCRDEVPTISEPRARRRSTPEGRFGLPPTAPEARAERNVFAPAEIEQVDVGISPTARAGTSARAFLYSIARREDLTSWPIRPQGFARFPRGFSSVPARNWIARRAIFTGPVGLARAISGRLRSNWISASRRSWVATSRRPRRRRAREASTRLICRDPAERFNRMVTSDLARACRSLLGPVDRQPTVPQRLASRAAGLGEGRLAAAQSHRHGFHRSVYNVLTSKTLHPAVGSPPGAWTPQ